jgi:hypothetical protein
VAAREETKRELELGLDAPEASRLLSRAEAVYERLTAVGGMNSANRLN